MERKAGSPTTPPVAKGKKKKSFFDRFSDKISRGTGKPIASVGAFIVVLAWALSGPLFGYSQTWQLMINTTTTIVTFLMVFIIQQSQNRDGMALQLKLNELIASHERASNRLIDSEDLSAEELDLLKKFYVKLGALAEESKDIFSSHSIDEAEKVHDSKGRIRKAKPVANSGRQAAH